MDNTNENNEIKFGERLRELRKSRGLQQSELGRLFDLSPSAIGSYERGVREPAYNHLVAFADYFHVSVDYLLGRSEEKMTAEEYANHDMSELFDILTKSNLTLHGYVLTESEKRRIGDIAVGMLWSKFPKTE